LLEIQANDEIIVDYYRLIGWNAVLVEIASNAGNRHWSVATAAFDL